MATKERIVKFIKDREGGFVNDPNDRGGATNKGVTLSTYRKVCGSGKTVEDLKRISDAEWEKVFCKEFWGPLHCDLLPQGVAEVITDFAWHSGISRAVKYAQALCRTVADGCMGRVTVGALGRVEVANFVRDYCELRRKYLLRLAGLNDQEERTLTLARSVPSRLPLTSRAGNKRFIIGWLKRVNDLEKMCLKGDGTAG